MSKLHLSVICFAIVSPLGLIAAPAFDVQPSAKRAVTVELAKKMVSQESSKGAAPSVNPFTLNGSRTIDAATDEAQAAAAKAAIMASNKNLLEALVNHMEPKGTFVVGGDPIILIGQKKLKVGETYSINFEGAVYEVEITAIESTRFSVRYKNEEITRPIVITKSGK